MAGIYQRWLQGGPSPQEAIRLVENSRDHLEDCARAHIRSPPACSDLLGSHQK
jgi:hypothetical protein